MWPNPQEIANLVTFSEEILNGKLHFLCSVICMYVFISVYMGHMEIWASGIGIGIQIQRLSVTQLKLPCELKVSSIYWYADSSPAGQFPDWHFAEDTSPTDTSPTGHFLSKTFPRTDISPTGHFPDHMFWWDFYFFFQIIFCLFVLEFTKLWCKAVTWISHNK